MIYLVSFLKLFLALLGIFIYGLELKDFPLRILLIACLWQSLI